MANVVYDIDDVVRVNTRDAPAGFVRGAVDRTGTPGAYPVTLHERATGRLIRRTLSGTDGAYTFSGVKIVTDGYYAVALDTTQVSPKQAAIADRLTPTPT